MPRVNRMTAELWLGVPWKISKVSNYLICAAESPMPSSPPAAHLNKKLFLRKNKNSQRQRDEGSGVEAGVRDSNLESVVVQNKQLQHAGGLPEIIHFIQLTKTTRTERFTGQSIIELYAPEFVPLAHHIHADYFVPFVQFICFCWICILLCFAYKSTWLNISLNVVMYLTPPPYLTASSRCQAVSV